MYEMLTRAELTMLQNILFEGTEEAYRVADLMSDCPHSFMSYRQVHREVGHLFIEAGTELLEWLDQDARVA
jgi:hypothetical protein